MFEETPELTYEQAIEAKRTVLIRGIAEDVIELLAKNTSGEDIGILIGRKFTENFGEGQNIQTLIAEAFKDSAVSELEALTMKIDTYKKFLEK
ncbi:MAG: hypothetical protein WC608_03455 [Parcubacteria group bacterium]